MRVATFNILHGRSLSDGKVDVSRLTRAVQELDADILALQEVDRDQPRSQLADLTEVAAKAMGALDFRFVAALSGTPGATWVAATGREQPGTASYGISLLSRWPVETWQVLRLPRIPMRFPMWLPGPRKVVVVHEEPRAAMIAAVRTPAGCVTVANSHLSFVPGWNRLQLAHIKRDLAPFPDPVLLMGDLNMTPPGPEQITGFRPLASVRTFPIDEPTKQLDHVLLRGAPAQVVGSRAVATELSDHRALIVEVDL